MFNLGRPHNLIKIVEKTAKKSPNRLAYLFLEDGEREKANLTYGELSNKAKTIAAYLQRQRLITERALLLYPAGTDFLTAFMGCLYAGVVAVPVSCPVISEFENAKGTLLAIAKDAEIKVILTVPEMVPVIEQGLGQLLAEKSIYVVDTTSFENVEDYHPIQINEDAIAYLQYTSGSTSMPKGVIVRHKQVTHTLCYTGRAWEYSPNSIAFHWAPHSHAYGLLYGLLTPLYFKALAIFMPPAAFVKQPLAWLKVISRYQVTHSGAPNFGYEWCATLAKENENLELGSWKVAVVTAEPVQNVTLTKFCDRFASYGFSPKSFFPAYGMSEAGIIASKLSQKKEPKRFHLSLEELKNKHVQQLSVEKGEARTLVSCGPLLSGFDALVVDPNTLKPVKADQIGEIWLSGLLITDGYWRRTEENSKTFKAILANSRHTYFRTGDLGFIHKGEIVLTGRLKELIIIYGKNYYPLDLETTVKNAHPLLKEHLSVAFSLTLEQKEEVFIVQEVKEEMALNFAGEIFKAIRQALSEQQKVNVYGIVFVKVGAIPRTSSGKVQRKLCSQQYLEGKLQILIQHVKHIDKWNQAISRSEGVSGTDREEKLFKTFQEKLIELVASAFQIESQEINLEDPLSQYGFDSLSLVKLTQLLKENYGIEITPTLLLDHKNLSSFSRELFNQFKGVFINFYQQQSVNHKEVAYS